MFWSACECCEFEQTEHREDMTCPVLQFVTKKDRVGLLKRKESGPQTGHIHLIASERSMGLRHVGF